MGLQRTSMALTEAEKEVVVLHEAVTPCSPTLLEHADPVHKVTILRRAWRS